MIKKDLTMIKDKIEQYMVQSNYAVFLSKEFYQFGSRSGVRKALLKLYAEFKIVFIGRGMLMKTRYCKEYNADCAIIDPYQMIEQLMEKLNIDFRWGRAIRAYDSGYSNQVPAKTIIDTYKRRITRKINYGLTEIIYQSQEDKKRRKEFGWRINDKKYLKSLYGTAD